MAIRGISGLSHVMPLAERLAKAALAPKAAPLRDAGSIALASDVWAPSGEVPPVTGVKLFGQESAADAPEDPGLPPDPVTAAAAKACGAAPT